MDQAEAAAQYGAKVANNIGDTGDVERVAAIMFPPVRTVGKGERSLALTCLIRQQQYADGKYNGSTVNIGKRAPLPE